jgi:hypothetical protein
MSMLNLKCELFTENMGNYEIVYILSIKVNLALHSLTGRCFVCTISYNSRQYILNTVSVI